VVQQGEMVVGTSLVGVVQNGLSQLHGVTSRAHFTVAMIRGLGGNLTLSSREAFAKQVIVYTHYVCVFTFLSPVTHICAYVCLYICVCMCVYVCACMCIGSEISVHKRACHISDTIMYILDQVSYLFLPTFLCEQEWEVSGLPSKQVSKVKNSL
jgi:hypothetical protein